MRKPGLMLFLVVVLGVPSAFSQQKNEFTFFFSNPGFSYSSSACARAAGGIGLSFSRMFTPRISGQLAIISESDHTYGYVVGANGAIVPVDRRHFRTYPIDATIRYHFFTDSRWKPFLGIGAHYVGAPSIRSEFGYRNRVGPELIGGTVFQIGRSYGLVFDAKAYFGKHESYDPPVRASIGFDWRF